MIAVLGESTAPAPASTDIVLATTLAGSAGSVCNTQVLATILREGLGRSRGETSEPDAFTRP